MLGIVGPNGCGKSTLLQLICGILQPTRGRVVTSGRVAALLELGAGFNPEFTGRENVYLNGEIMGLNWGEIARALPSIAAFADIGEFLERPVKEYSSGMYVRLAFAVAAHLNPEILIVDEVLAVGDGPHRPNGPAARRSRGRGRLPPRARPGRWDPRRNPGHSLRNRSNWQRP